MSDSLFVVLRAPVVPLFDRDMIENLALQLVRSGYRLREMRGRTSPPIDHQIAEEWVESDVPTFARLAAESRDIHFPIWDGEMAMSLSSFEDESRETRVTLDVDRVYFRAETRSGPGASPDAAQKVLRLTALLASVLRPKHVYGAYETYLHAIQDSASGPRPYGDIPWLLDVRLSELPSELQEEVSHRLTDLMAPLPDGRTLIALSADPGVLGSDLPLQLQQALCLGPP